MPEKGRYSLTIRKKTAVRVRELARDMDLTVDEFINEHMKPIPRRLWSTCMVCGARVKAGNMVKHMARVSPESRRLRRHDLTGQ